MPETAQAPVASETQPATRDDQRQAHAVQLPEAPESAPTSAGGQFDILLDMDVPVKVVLGATEIPVRELLQLGPGAVLKLEKSIEAPAELFLKDAKFAEAEIVVVDNRFAARITRITAVNGGQTED